MNYYRSERTCQQDKERKDFLTDTTNKLKFTSHPINQINQEVSYNFFTC